MRNETHDPDPEEVDRHLPDAGEGTPAWDVSGTISCAPNLRRERRNATTRYAGRHAGTGSPTAIARAFQRCPTID